jgi:hypothetical protein
LRLRSDKQINEPDKAFCAAWLVAFMGAIHTAVHDPHVVGFKSVVCYRTGLNVLPMRQEYIDSVASSPESTADHITQMSHPTINLMMDDTSIADDLIKSVTDLYVHFNRNIDASNSSSTPAVRIQHKTLNDIIVGITMAKAGAHDKPGDYFLSLCCAAT